MPFCLNRHSTAASDCRSLPPFSECVLVCATPAPDPRTTKDPGHRTRGAALTPKPKNVRVGNYRRLTLPSSGQCLEPFNNQRKQRYLMSCSWQVRLASVRQRSSGSAGHCETDACQESGRGHRSLPRSASSPVSCTRVVLVKILQ